MQKPEACPARGEYNKFPKAAQVAACAPAGLDFAAHLHVKVCRRDPLDAKGTRYPAQHPAVDSDSSACYNGSGVAASRCLLGRGGR
jgi:hypothetical protein